MIYHLTQIKFWDDLILKKDNQPSPKLLVESIEQFSELFVDNSNLKYYAKVKNQNGKIQLREIFTKQIMDYSNKAFGPNKISRNTCKNVLNFITRDIEKDYSLLEFNNGTLKLDTNNYTFMKDKFITDRVPKIVFPFEWNPTFEKNEEDKIENIIKETLKCEESGFEENINNFYKSIGNTCMPTNEFEKAIIFLGQPGTGKSTLLTMIKKVFSYSEIPIPDIIKNERFALYSAIDKIVTIDDDLQASDWTNIGKLNTFISGGGVEVEKKRK